MKIVAFEFNNKEPENITVQVAVDDNENPEEALEKSRQWVANQTQKPKTEVKKDYDTFKQKILQSFEEFEQRFSNKTENIEESNSEQKIEEITTENASDDVATTT